jgi:ATP/maltotriose-dependent transcriptional regulator MalT
MADWWLENHPASIEARERAYRLYRSSGQRAAAARLAVWLSNDYSDFRGDTAIANGWLRRAGRLLEGLDPAPEHALLAYMQAHVALMAHRDPAEARRLSAKAAEIARRVGPPDVEMLGVALEGLALVTEGEVAAGMSCLDEASAAAMAGELSDPVMIGTSCCYLIRACEQVHDYDRAAQWCERVREFCRRWEYTHLFNACRIQYVGLLTLRGEWDEAEAEIQALHRHVKETQPRLIPVAVARLADLRRRQGRWEEAEQLYQAAGSHLLAILGRAALALDRGEPTAAADLAEQYLSQIPERDRTERIAGLEVLIGARIGEGSFEDASRSLAELEAIAEKVGTQPLRATVAFVEGCLLEEEGDHRRAAALLEESAVLFERNRTPFEAARSLFQLTKALLALGRREPASIAVRSAREIFEELGAARGAGAARLLMQEIQPHRSSGGFDSGQFRLTTRELEVLRLVAEGLSDREIAGTLELSEHTVHRHVSNILTKTGLPSRSAAVAQATRSGLL